MDRDSDHWANELPNGGRKNDPQPAVFIFEPHFAELLTTRDVDFLLVCRFYRIRMASSGNTLGLANSFVLVPYKVKNLFLCKRERGVALPMARIRVLLTWIPLPGYLRSH